VFTKGEPSYSQDFLQTSHGSEDFLSEVEAHLMTGHDESNLKYRRIVIGRKLAMLVLPANDWSTIRRRQMRSLRWRRR
jgi:hypothetical protein